MLARFTLERGSLAGQLVVGGVAVGAVGRHREAALQQPLAVDALHVVLDDVLLLARVAHAPPSAPMRWHLAHRAGTLREKVGEFESFLPSVPCGPWQSRHAGASGLPLREQLAVRALAVLVDRLGVADRAIHLGRDRAARPRLGRVCRRCGTARRRSRAWRECASSSSFTNSETVCPPRVTFSSGSPWQRWQSWSAMPCV